MTPIGQPSVENRYYNALCSAMKSVTACAVKVAKVVAPVFGALADFADGFARTTALVFGLVGLVFIAFNPAGSLTVVATALGVILLSKKILSDTVAASCYEFADIRKDHPLRWVPYCAGASVSLIQFQGAMLFF